MTKNEYISIALARWIIGKLDQSNDFAREGLPRLDVPTFFRQLASEPSFPADDFSIAISGMDASTTDLLQVARQVGLDKIRDFADDLHVAAEWRNDRTNHPRTIALATGYNVGVQTLGHYARPASSDVARSLLEYAIDNLKDAPDVHRTLLSRLLVDSDLEPLLSLEACAEFLERWDSHIPVRGTTAPIAALPALGLLVDEQLFGSDDLGKRLAKNLETVQQVRTIRASTLRSLARKEYKNAARKKDVAEAIEHLERYLADIVRGAEGNLSLSKALVVVRPPKDDPPTDDSVIEDEEVEMPSVGGDDDGKSLPNISADALLDGHDDDLEAISDGFDDGWKEFDESSGTEVKVIVTLPSSGTEHSGTIRVDPRILSWAGDFCSEENWGGAIETTETSLYAALTNAADNDPVFLTPDRAVIIEGESLSLETLFAGWDEDLPELIGRNTQLASTWKEFRVLRSSLLPHLGKLVYHARSWLDGRSEMLHQVRRYLELTTVLYRQVQENYRIMASRSGDWARATLEVLLSLDIVQVRVRMPDGKTAAKAVLLPTHPLHLWRNERLSTLLRGLAQSTTLTAEDRKVIREELERPEQFLSVIRLSSIPDGRGLNQLLPLTSQIEGLPVFENLINACSGSDGAKALRQALDQYMILNPNHPYPLRIAMVNPPKPEAMMMELVRLLNDPRYRSRDKLSAIHASVYATAQHGDRLRSALAFSDTQKEDEVQAKIASGRLHLHLDETCLSDPPSLEKAVERVKQRPVHVMAIFDESTISLRQRMAGRNLPMSPFCIRYEVQLDHRSGRIELQPQPGESPFSEFLLLMNEMEGSQRDATPHAYADAQALAGTADKILQGDRPAARWLFLADRALPSESGMESVRIWERKEGMRDTFLATRNFDSMSRLIRPVFARCNLMVTPDHMSRLLHQGARLLGSGMLEIIKKQDGQPDKKKVIGFAGLLFAARDFQRRHPGALVLSVDHPLARLWLRTGSRSFENRCDLLALWKEDGIFHVVASEVKTSDSQALTDGPDRIAHAEKQIRSTLEALEDGLNASFMAPESPLSIPRCEMLKQTFARAAQSRSGNPKADAANRRLWGKWLVELFASDRTSRPDIRLSGCVVSIPLRRAGLGPEDEVLSNERWKILHRMLAETDMGNLLDWEPYSETVPAPARTPGFGDQSSEGGLEGVRSDPADTTQKPRVSDESGTGIDETVLSITGWNAVPDSHAPRSQLLGHVEESPPDDSWPPTVNPLGLIGQNEAVNLLVKQAVFAKATHKRFSDKLLVGPAGVGKSTLVRRIGEMLLGRDPVFYNGADLRRPGDLLERLVQEGLAPRTTKSVGVTIKPCIIFIDEVHGISSSVATTLLSAMDDRRETSIEGKIYDFNQVVFLLATTDQGKLTEAFQSRPDKTWLRPYTLHEMAGIIWLHGKKCMKGAELSREACYEIAARNRCNPRQCVRQLSEVLLPHFFNEALNLLAHEGRTPTEPDAAELMTVENISKFYESQGTDRNGLNNHSKRFLFYLKQHGAVSESTLCQALGITHRQDFVEVSEYLVRLGLIETGPAGRRLTRQGLKYLNADSPPDLRHLISRAMLL